MADYTSTPVDDGTAPAGSDGDTTRAAFIKVSADLAQLFASLTFDSTSNRVALANDLIATRSVASDDVEIVLTNSSTGAGAGTRIKLSSSGSASGASDPRVSFNIDGVLNWSVGVDNSDSDAFKIGRDDVVGVNTSLEIDTSGNVTLIEGDLIVATTNTPASASATGTTGTIAWDSSFIYICVATDTWERVAIATW